MFEDTATPEIYTLSLHDALPICGRVDPAGGWRMPAGIFLVAWILMAVGYSYSGYTKLISPSWIDGTALARIFDNPLARPGFLRDAVLQMPSGLLNVATWGALALELQTGRASCRERV